MNEGVQHFLELLLVMTEKELRARYKHTIFGFFWLIANPLMQMLVIGFVFTFFMKEPILHYNYYLFIGLLIWNFFSVSLNKTTPSIVFERSLIKKAAFPREVIPLSIILSNAVHFIAALFLYIVPVIFLGTMTSLSVLYLLIGILLLFTFTIGLSLFTTALNVRYRDISFFVQAILIIWFYATPIVYSFNFIPYKFIWLWRLNPMTSIVQLFQHGFLNAPLPGPGMLTANCTVILIITILGIYIFQKESNNFDDWV
jgi:lipopolysaccharide transport system permease protein